MSKKYVAKIYRSIGKNQSHYSGSYIFCETTTPETIFRKNWFMLDEMTYLVKCFKICHIFGI